MLQSGGKNGSCGEGSGVHNSDTSPPVNDQAHWLVEMRESEEMLQRQCKSSTPPNSLLNKCGSSVDAVAQWFIRYGTTKGPPTSRRHGDRLIVFLAVVSTFEAFAILYLLKAYETCM